jgi:hypothetical protein
MQRRDLSKILLASSAASVLATRSAQAQTCTAPCYARTAAEVAASVTPTNLAYQQGDVRRYGADPTGAADSTTAIQSALNVGQAVYLPAGNYAISAALTNAVAKRRIYGDGPAISVLKPTGAINTIVNTAGLSCVLMDNFPDPGNQLDAGRNHAGKRHHGLREPFRESGRLRRRSCILFSDRIQYPAGQLSMQLIQQQRIRAGGR